MDLDKQLMSACACFGSATLPEVAPVRSSEQAAEAVKNAHWEGTKVADASDWKINDESCYDADFEYVGPGETRLSGFRAGWRRVLGGLLDAVADWRWNLRVVVPDEGFDVVDGFIEVPYRISPTCVARKGAVLAFEGREFVVRADTEVVLRAGQESEIPNFKGSYLSRFPLVSADFWTSDHLSERSRRVDAFPERARAEHSC